jgi:hypothetical protein
MILDGHVTEVVRSSNYHIRALKHIQSSLILAARMIAHGVVAARLERTISWHVELLFRPVSYVSEHAGHAEQSQTPWSSSAIEVRRSLHVLAVGQRVDNKLLVITYLRLD